MSSSSHIKLERLVAMIDDELSTAERLEILAHLQACPECKRHSTALTTTSRELERFFTPALSVNQHEAKTALLSNLKEAVGVSVQEQPSSTPATARFLTGWLGRGSIAAVAASLVLLLWLHSESASKGARSITPSAAPSDSALLEVDGESFLPLPYSNADLPIGSPHVLRMHVPAASLAEAGLFLQPDSGGIGDRAILADVLLGVDGEPLGVHVLEQ